MKFSRFFLLGAVALLFVGCSSNQLPSVSDMLNNKSEEKEEKNVVLDFATVDKTYQFSAEIPKGFAVEYISAIDSINIYKPGAGENNLESSQIFIRNFRANSFLTLQTVDISKKVEMQQGNHEAVLYKIKKKEGVPNFPNQPSWRNQEHEVLDIRYSNNNPSTFFVFSHTPDFSNEEFETFIGSVVFHNDKESLKEPLYLSKDRVTKKPFGIQVSPDNSPVPYERFSGFHTGTDYEISKEEDWKPVPVDAVCSGEIVGIQKATGYGGVILQRCSFADQVVTVIYGHVAIDQVSYKKGDHVTAGTQLTVLGEGDTEETGGERKHLHLGIRKGVGADIRGYVPNKFDLENWIDFQKWRSVD